MARGQMEKRTYLSIMQGKVVERLGVSDKRAETLNQDKIKEDYPGCNRIREIIKDDKFTKTVFEQVDDYIEGAITKISIRDSDWGPQLQLEIDDGIEVFILQMNADTSNARAFMNIAPNIDPLADVKIRPWKDKKTKSEGLNISQGGTKIEYFFTKDNPNGHPAPPAFTGTVDYNNWTIKQKQEYDMYKLQRISFLTEYLTEKVAPKFDIERQVTLPPSDEFPEEKEQKPKPAPQGGIRREDLPEPPLASSDDLPF